MGLNFAFLAESAWEKAKKNWTLLLCASLITTQRNTETLFCSFFAHLTDFNHCCTVKIHLFSSLFCMMIFFRHNCIHNHPSEETKEAEAEKVMMVIDGLLLAAFFTFTQQ